MSTPRHVRNSFLAAGLLAVSVCAQTTTHSLTVGGAGSFGCQNADDPPTLDDGFTLASAQLDFTYDSSSHVLQLDVTNTSPVTAGVKNPLIVRVAFNLPPHAVDSASLVSQAGSGGAAPDFVLAVDPDNTTAPNDIKMACFGDFSVSLTRPSIAGGIANADADTIPGPVGAAVLGPVTFVLQLDGPGVGSLTAQSIALAFSQNAPAHQTNAVAKFQGGGPQDASGFIGSTASGTACRASMYLTGEPRIGSSISLCLGAESGCHGCLVGSLTPGPVTVGGFTVRIGLPFAFVLPITPFPAAPVCVPLTIPDDQSMIGFTLYMTIATIGASPTAVEFSPAFALTVLP